MVSPSMIFLRLAGSFILNTTTGRLLSLHIVNAVESIILSLLAIASSKDRVSYFFAFGSFSGSDVYTPSTLVPLRRTSAPISTALSAAAVSVVKNGLPVPLTEYKPYYFSLHQAPCPCCRIH